MKTTRSLLSSIALLLCLPGLASAQPSTTEPLPAQPAEGAEPAFDIWEFAIEGNSVLPVVDIEAAVQGQLGPRRSMKSVEAARAALQAAYERAGYLTVGVDVPEQSVDDGVVRLVVVEGHVGALYVTGSKYHDQGFIRARVASLAPGSVPDFNQVQAQLATVNRAEDRRVQPILKPGSRPGTVDVELQVNDSLPLSGSLELNNQHSRDTEPLRLLGTVRHANLFQVDHALSLMLQTAPQDTAQSRVLVANYLVPQEDGRAWTVSLSVSDSDVETLGGTQILGQGTTLGVRRSWAFAGASGAASLTLGADLKFLQENTVFGTDSISTPLHYLPFQVAYADQWEGGYGRLQFHSSLVFALAPLLAREVDCPLADGSPGRADQFACKRQGGDGSFALLRWDARLSPPVPWGRLMLRLAGQYAAQPLVSAEQFSIGGADSVRGYFDGEASGDHGLMGTVEWRTANTAAGWGVPWRDLTLASFVDVGRVTTLMPLAGQAARVPLAGAGLGLRFALNLPGTDGLDGGLDLAWPLKTTTATERLAPRLHARLQARF